jgi:S-adenosylmethionine:tRNA ribosyltransferase-isomerase
MKKSDFNYELPAELIAQHPLADRTASRMLCLDKGSGKVQDRFFKDFLDVVNTDDLLVFNNTRVIPARLYGQKTTGGKVEILLERVIDHNNALAHVKASKAPKVGSEILLDKGFICRVQGRENDLFVLEFSGNASIDEILEQIGHIPLPPYIQREDEALDLERYQTVFAEQAGAVAAPTAGLHFDDAMMTKLSEKGVQTTFVTLHVGSGTFQPVRVENLAEHIMHTEYYSVTEETVAAVQKTRACGGRVICIGTTSVRALESASRQGALQAGCGDTDLFITPGYTFKSVDALLTNFHLPESTLLMLIAAFAGYDHVMQAYRHAVENHYRFFSYGDAMLIL